MSPTRSASRCSFAMHPTSIAPRRVWTDGQGARVRGRGGSTTPPTKTERTLPRVQEGGLEAECSPKQVILGECRCPHVDWNAYGALLAEALRAVEKLVPAVALDRDTPM